MAPEAKANGDCYFLRGELGDRRQKGPAGIKVTVTFALTLTFSSPMLSTFCPLYCESLLVLKDKLEGNTPAGARPRAARKAGSTVDTEPAWVEVDEDETLVLPAEPMSPAAVAARRGTRRCRRVRARVVELPAPKRKVSFEIPGRGA